MLLSQQQAEYSSKFVFLIYIVGCSCTGTWRETIVDSFQDRKLNGIVYIFMQKSVTDENKSEPFLRGKSEQIKTVRFLSYPMHIVYYS